MTCFWCTFGFGKCFGASLQYNRWGGGCHLSYNIHFSSHVTVRLRNDSLLLCTIREDDISGRQFFFFCSQLMWHPLTEVFHLSNLLQMPNDYRMMLSSSATSSVAVRGSASVILSLDGCQLPMAGHCASHFQASRLLCKTSWTTIALYIH